MSLKHPWFVAKRFGIGLRPRGWRGALALAVFLVVLMGFVTTAPRMLSDQGLAPGWTALGAAVLVIAFLVVVVATSDPNPLRWRWGRD